MASVTAVLPLHNEFQNNRLRWQDFANGLIDVSALRADAGTAWIVRFQPSGNGADVANNVQIRTVETPDGGGGTSSGPQLSDAAEQYVSFATISVPGMTDLVLAGPNNPNVADQDTNEPYQWIPGGTYDNGAITYNLLAAPHPAAGLAGWVGDFLTTYAADNTVRATLTLDDGVGGTTPTDLEAAGSLTGGLTGSIVGAARLSALPLEAAGELTGGLSGSIQGAAALVDPVMAPSAMEGWLRSLLLPWDELTGRWATALALADTFQGLIDAAEQARHEWSPVTCRTATLPAWGRVLGRPRRTGESTADYRRRLALWRAEAVGTSGWVRDEVERITGVDPPRVLEFPRDGLVVGHGRVGVKRIGAGPSLTVGVEPTMRESLAAVLEAGVPPDVGINYLEPSVFDTL